MKYTNEEYLFTDPFEGERDVKIKIKRTALVKLRKSRECYGLANTEPHIIPAGAMSRTETGILDGKFVRADLCMNCMDEFLDKLNGGKRA